MILLILLKEKGVKKAIKLPVSAPFHCDLMDNAKLVMQNELMQILFLINRLFQLFKILLLMLQKI